MTVQQSSLLLDIKRLEKEAVVARLALLRILSKICGAYRDSANVDFERLQEQIDVNIALSDSVQDEVNEVREAHGKASVFLDDRATDDDDWDSAAEASSTVGGDASSVTGEASSAAADEGEFLSSGSLEL